MPDKVAAFGWGESLERGDDQCADLIEGSWPRGPQESLQLRKRQLDWIEVWTVRREKPQVRPDGFDGRANGGLFVRGEVVEHDDIAACQRRHKDLLDVREK